MLATFLATAMCVAEIIVPTQPTSFNFAVIGDTQVNKRVMKKASLSIKLKNLKFVAHVGDVDWCGYKGKWRRSRRIMRLSGLPWYMTIGNHELYSCGYPISFGYTRNQWSHFWWGNKSTFRRFRYGGKTFVFTDSSTYLYPRNHTKRLRRILSTAKDKSVFIFTHRPLAYHNTSMKVRYGAGKSYWHKYWVMGGMRYVSRNKTIWHTLKSYKKKILAVFHGHYHAYRSYYLDGIPVYCSGGGGGRLETKRDFYHYLVVSIRKAGVIVKVVRL